MKAMAKLKNLESESCKNTIIRNLNRIGYPISEVKLSSKQESNFQERLASMIV